jgi:competence protein ComEC
MSVGVPCFVLAILLITRLPVLLPIVPLLPALPIAFYGLRLPMAMPACAFFLGLIFALASAQNGLNKGFPSHLENLDLEIEGRVVSLPVRKEGIERFRLELSSIKGCDDCWSGLIMLSWYRSTIIVNPGDHLRLTVKLARPRASLNPGVFDYEGWLFFKGIRATGYVKGSEGFERITDSSISRLPSSVDHKFRAYLRNQIQKLAADSPIKGLLIALVIGESGQISTQQWQSLTKTGTNHLLIISGLHVGLVAAMTFKALSLMAIPLRWVGVFTSLFVIAYGFIAGLGLPVQRALIMTVVVLFAATINRRMTLPAIFSTSLLGVVIVDPFAIMSNGFWLSFGAVFALLFAFGSRIEAHGKPTPVFIVKSAIHTQWVVFVTMFPVLLYLLYQASIIGFLVNLVAIPFVSLLVIPWLLLFVVLCPVSETLAAMALQVSEFFLSIIWQFIVKAAELDWVVRVSGEGIVPFISAVLGAYLLLMPKGLIPRWLALFCFLPILLVEGRLAEDELQISFIDVGQGLSVLIRTRHSALLYDAGPKFGNRFDSGEQTVTPFLRHQGVRYLNTLIVSHADNDHAGGAGAIQRNFDPSRVFFSGNTLEGNEPSSCDYGSVWYEDSIRFEAFTLQGSDLTGNDHSCLLLVSGTGFAILLTGDIELLAENALRKKQLPEMTVISVPHHGSKTSSSPGFVNHVKTDIAVVSAGYLNRFGHPDAGVLRRYRVRQVKVFNTASEGAVSILLGKMGVKRIEVARQIEKRFWHRPGMQYRDSAKKKGRY